MKKGTVNMLMYAGIAVAAVAVLAIFYYGSAGAATSAVMKTVRTEAFEDDAEEGFENDDGANDGEDEGFEDSTKEAEAKDAKDKKDDVKEGFYGGYDAGQKDYAAAGGVAGRKSVPSTDHANCYTRDGLNPNDLLPKPSAEASQFLASNPPTSGSPDNRNLLQSGYHIGVDTVCQTNKNPNLQLRSDPPIARCGTQPIFNSSSIPAQQNNRLALEIGSQINPEGCADFKKDTVYP